MPHFCAAFGCANERNSKTKQRGITFHRFPKAKDKREAWKAALRRANFEPSNHSVLCSSHFKPEDFDMTGQTTRLREGVIPSVFKFPEKTRKVQSPLRPKMLARKTVKSAKSVQKEAATRSVKTDTAKSPKQTAAAECPDQDVVEDDGGVCMEVSEDPKEPTAVRKPVQVSPPSRSRRAAQTAAAANSLNVGTVLPEPKKKPTSVSEPVKQVSSTSTPQRTARKTIRKQPAQTASTKVRKELASCPVKTAPVKLPVNVKQPEGPKEPTPSSEPVALDHLYTLDPDNMKKKLVEAHQKVEELTRELRNVRDRERRLRKIVTNLLDDLKKLRPGGSGATTQA
ncbi:THAP domain-containing protein 3-like isoform X1 [Cheilinus undulatus]|uniref:THAP domain-containing protein 3-like isoform X1 n=1 Tax=Cheilinus undulatus TaxID=241271 RepID=UPI001BD3D04F|nr:THAP domain-containing protein 3-like isoform X1 [Cheilinus undulatus]